MEGIEEVILFKLTAAKGLLGEALFDTHDECDSSKGIILCIVYTLK